MNKLIKSFTGLAAVLVAFLFAISNAKAARTDMVDVSNHNGYMSTAEFVSMRQDFGVKAVTTKITEGVSYFDPDAKSNIANAQKAKLYVNGYHFARYYSAATAVAEGNYAGRMAQIAGLPVGAVLVADVEAPQQAANSQATNDLNNTLFQRAVAKYGYRTDIYTMGSWLNYRMKIQQGGWVASYPRATDGLNWFSTHHAWQWASDYHFKLSFGNFDVSQLYDNFYTAGQKSVVKATSPKQNTQVEDYDQTATFRPNRQVAVHTGLGANTKIVAHYQRGETLIYNHVYLRNSGYVWARYQSYTGQNHYICLGKLGGSNYGERRLKNILIYYTVQSGDSWWQIARHYQISMYQLARQNRQGTSNTIYPGQILFIN